VTMEQSFIRFPPAGYQVSEGLPENPERLPDSSGKIPDRPGKSYETFFVHTILFF
jgi:hypothetical protein